MAVYIRHVRNLDFFETPNYDLLSNLFRGLLKRIGCDCDWKFDWIVSTEVGTVGLIKFSMAIDALLPYGMESTSKSMNE